MLAQATITMNWMQEALERLLPLKLRVNTEMYNKIQDSITSAKICRETELLSMSRDQVNAANIPDPDEKQIPHVCVIPRVTESNDELTSCKNVCTLGAGPVRS